MSQKVYVTGIGIISSLGNNVNQNLDALLNERSGIGLSKYLTTKLAANFLFGEVNKSNEELAAQSFCSKFHNNSRTALLGLTAAFEALNSASINSRNLDKFGLLSATTVGGMEITEQYYKDFLERKDFNYNKAFEAHDCGFSAEYIADNLGITDFITTISTACSSSANSIAQAFKLIKTGKLKGALAGGAEALSNFTFHGFNSLMILDPERCKPFDENRKGLNLGEGAAFLVLESEDSVINRKIEPLAEVAGTGNANDAYHQTASSPGGTGATLAIEKALKEAALDKADISYINAHGTGTSNNDLSEVVALKNIFGENIPEFSSTKSYTGHTLGATGAIEAVFSILAIKNNVAFANNKVQKSVDLISKIPLQITKNINIKSVLSNSFGFGGNCSSLIFKAV